MSSTLKPDSRDATRRAVFASAIAAALAPFAGCTRAPAPAPEPTDTSPMVVDEAMQRRDWPRSTAEWANGDVVAGATRFPYVPQTEGAGAGKAVLGPERSNAVLDTGAFVAQSIALPFTYFVDPPFTEKVYQGVIYEPTFTAVPVLPPDEEAVEGYSVPPEAAPAEVEPVDPDEPVDDAAKTPDTLIPAQRPPEPAPDEPAPPAEVPVEPLPPAPDVTEPAPPEPAPEVTEPVVPEPAPTEPAPTEPAPVPVEPALPEPAAVEPAPVEPEPAPVEPAPEAVEPAPVEPAPAEPAPEATEPAPLPEPAPAEPTEPAPQPELAPEAVEPAPQPEPAPEVEPSPEPAPEPAPAPEDQNK